MKSKKLCGLCKKNAYCEHRDNNIIDCEWFVRDDAIVEEVKNG